MRYGGRCVRSSTYPPCVVDRTHLHAFEQMFLMLGLLDGEVRLSTGAVFIHRFGGSAVVAAKCVGARI